MSEQTKSAVPSEDLTETTASADIELQEEDLNRISGGGTDIKTEPFK